VKSWRSKFIFFSLFFFDFSSPYAERNFSFNFAKNNIMKAALQYVIVFTLFSATCSYAQIPVISSFSPVAAKVGKTVTITGSGFHTNPDSSIVYFGSAFAEIISATSTQLQVKVPVGSSCAPVCLYTRGYTLFSNLNFVPTFDGASLNANSFSSNMDFSVTNMNFKELKVADLNADKRPDIIKYPGLYYNDISVFENKADSGQFNDTCLKAEISVLQFGTDTSVLDMLIHDFDHDSLPDIIALVKMQGIWGDYVWLDFIKNTSDASGISFSHFYSKIIRNSYLGIPTCPGGPTGTAEPILMYGMLKISDLNYDGEPDYIADLNWENWVCSGYGQKYLAEIFVVAGIHSPSGGLQHNVEILQAPSADMRFLIFDADDLNNDGRPDMITSWYTASTSANSTYLNTNTNAQGGGISSFAPSYLNNQGTHVWEDLHLTDIDGDSKPDYFRTTYGYVYRNTHTGGNLSVSSFTLGASLFINDSGQNAEWADMNGDNRPDVVSLKSASYAATVTQNNCQPGTINAGSFVTYEYTILGSQPEIVALHDMDQDGKPDIITGNSGSKLSVLKNLITAEFVLDTLVCANEYDTITYTGTAGAGASYTWDINGAVVISGSGQGPLVVAWPVPGLKTVTLTIDEGGNITTVSRNVTVLPVPTSSFSLPAYIYINEAAAVTYTGTGSTAAHYFWNFDGGIVLSGSGQGPYEVSWALAGNRQISLYVEENGCISDTTVITKNIFSVYQEERICVVTVDPASGKNMVVWEKTPGVNIASYNIYKEVSTNFYSWIANIPYNSMSTYVDAGSSPEAHPDRYKLSILDSMGSESFRSPYHMTIHLQASAGVPSTNINLSWTHYYDEEGAFVPAKYYIFRGTQPTGMTLLDSVSGSYSTYTDVNVLSPYYYMIGAVRAGGCNPTTNKSIYDGPNSNIKDISGLVQMNDLGAQSYKLNVYPNPANDICSVQLPATEKQKLTVTIHDITGKTVMEWQCGSENLNFSVDALSPGLYTLRVKGECEYFGRFAVE
jgi:hypothetical protein